MIWHISSWFRIGVHCEDLVAAGAVVAAIGFCRVPPCPSLSSDVIGDGGSGVVGLGALSSVKALSSPSAIVERSRFSTNMSMLFSSFVSVLSVF